MRYLTFALAKGRLANKTMELLEHIGIRCQEMDDPDSRKLKVSVTLDTEYGTTTVKGALG